MAEGRFSSGLAIVLVGPSDLLLVAAIGAEGDAYAARVGPPCLLSTLVERLGRRLPQSRAYDGVGTPPDVGHVEAERAAGLLGGGDDLAFAALVATATIAEGGIDGFPPRRPVPDDRAGAALAEGERTPDRGQGGVAQGGKVVHRHVARRLPSGVALPLSDRNAGFIGHPAVDLGDLVVQVVEPFLN